MTKKKYFLDTSAVRPVLVGSKIYKQYFKNQFKDGQMYDSQYLQMEFRRSYIRNILNFYFLLDMPHIETVGEALKIWSNKYKSSELKAIHQFIGDLLNAKQLGLDDKKKALREIN